MKVPVFQCGIIDFKDKYQDQGHARDTVATSSGGWDLCSCEQEIEVYQCILVMGLGSSWSVLEAAESQLRFHLCYGFHHNQ